VREINKKRKKKKEKKSRKKHKEYNSRDLEGRDTITEHSK